MMSKRALRSFVLGAAALALPLCVQAQEKPVGAFGWFGVGKAYELTKGHYYWVGEFSGTFFNDKGKGSMWHMAGVRCPAFNELNFNTGKGRAGGYCIVQDADGDQAVCSWRNEGNNKVGPGTFECSSGTGKYKNINTGTMTFVGVTEINWADGTASGYSTWNR